MGTICSYCSLFDQNVTIILYNESLEVTALDFEMNFKIVIFWKTLFARTIRIILMTDNFISILFTGCFLQNISGKYRDIYQIQIFNIEFNKYLKNYI